MSNKFPGKCHLCGVHLVAGEGITTRIDGSWKVQHDGECPPSAADAVAPSTAPTYTPTTEQLECAAIFRTGVDLVIQAGAGTGKTSTLILLAMIAREQGRCGWYGAFNRATVQDVAKKMPGNVNASTMHSLAYRAVGFRYKNRLNAPRQRQDVIAGFLGLDSWSYPFSPDGVKVETRTAARGWLAGKVLAALRSFCSTADPEITVAHFPRVDGIDMPTPDGRKTYGNNDELRRYLLPYARKAWADIVKVDGDLRYTHDYYLKLWQLSGPVINADFILFDEAQDADPVQVAIVHAQRKFDTQIVVVGDSNQSIYEWRGAVNALAEFEDEGAAVSYLSQSFRFGDAIAAVANNLLERLEAPIRLRGYGPVASTVGHVAEPTCILTRTNAGAIQTCLSTLDVGRRPFLVGGGKEVGSFCEAALDLQAGRRTSHPELACFGNWTEVQFYAANEEQGEDLRLMVKLIDEFGARRILDALAGQGKEEDADVVVSTAHKSKGRQWSSVQIHSDFPPPDEGTEMSPPEMRLAYVACTRAQHELDITAVPHFVGLRSHAAPKLAFEENEIEEMLR